MRFQENGSSFNIIGPRSAKLGLSASDAEHFDEYGYVQLPQLLSTDICEQLCVALNGWAETQTHKTAYGLLGHNIWQQLPLFKEVLEQSNIGAYAAFLLRSQTVQLFQDNIIWKLPQSTEEVKWHQDYTYWPLQEGKGVTIWVALEDATQENGCMRFIPRSHHWGECRRTTFGTEDTDDQQLPDLPLQKYAKDAVSLHCKQGHALAHHPLNCHMSPANRSTSHRRAWSLSFVDLQATWDTKHAPHPFNYYLHPADGSLIREHTAANFPIFHISETKI